MKSAITGFVANLDNLRGFVDLLSPVLTARRETQLKEDALYLAPLALAMSELMPDVISMDDNSRTALRGRFGECIEIRREAVGSKERAHISVTGELARPFREAMTRMGKAYGQIELLYRTALISLVSSAEWYISQLLHIYFERFPDAAGTTEKAFSLQDLKTLGTIQDAREYLIDLKVEDIVRGSFDDWLTFFRARPKLSMGYLDPHHDDLVEVFQRRNVVVHNGGIANRHYCTHVAEKYGKGINPGEPLQVTKEYLEDAISLFERSLLLVGVELWKKLDPEDDDRGDLLTNVAFDHLCAERWGVAESLSLFLAHDAKLPERSKMIGKINYWQSKKWQDRFDEVRSDVESEDVTAKEAIYRLAKHALLDEEDAFVELLRQMIAAETIPVADVKSWPLFRAMRSSERVCALLTVNSQPNGGNSSNSVTQEV